MEIKFITPNQESAQRFFAEHKDHEVVMLNVLKYKTKADYSAFKNLAPNTELTGIEAYKIYMESVRPLIEKVGAKVVYFGKASEFLIGPESRVWDAVLLVRYPSVEKFVQFSQSEAYQAIVGHRTAALEDSRLLPTYPVA